ncbi:serine/arginine repetitive matrix protein 2 [Ananas comosus]|uniref:Serine/arginine repetitive matrix protein 2 n=1 Tax=Ananas comosus TaxID=4615 RepID=A0A6P5GP87_ANACO|nr:serine/arginine repetitive matrix protein 2 [Ananas comosus]
MKQSETEITLEQYLHFYDHPCGDNLSRFHLNQIIYMHGFMKLHRLHKRNLMEVLEAIELAPPRRSTLGRGASARAALTAAEAAEDVAALGWEERPMRAVSTLESPADGELLAGASKLRRRRRGGGGGEGSARAPPPADFVVRGRRPRSKRKRASINALTAAASATGAAGAGSSSSSSSSSAPPPPRVTRSWTPPPPRPRSSPRRSRPPSLALLTVKQPILWNTVVTEPNNINLKRWCRKTRQKERKTE